MLTYTAPFAQKPITGVAIATLAGDLLGSNTLLIATAGIDGALVTRLTAMTRATVTATSLQLFISRDTGTTKILMENVLMAAHTVATTTIIPLIDFANISETTPIRLKAGDQLYVSASVALAGGIVFTTETTDF